LADNPELAGRKHQPSNLTKPPESQLSQEGSSLYGKASLPRLNQAASSQARPTQPPSKKQKIKTNLNDSLAQPLESLEPFEPFEPFVPPLPVILESGHAAQRKATAAAWAELLPKLVYPLMEWKCYQGKGQSKASPLCSCSKWEKKVNVISFTSACFMASLFLSHV
jgi:hypothetical protein